MFSLLNIMFEASLKADKSNKFLPKSFHIIIKHKPLFAGFNFSNSIQRTYLVFQRDSSMSFLIGSLNKHDTLVNFGIDLEN